MPTTTFQEDLVDEFNWTTLETVFDDNGEKISREIVYDNSVVRSDEYENGALVSTRQIDGAQDARPWQSLETAFDENGLIAGRFEVRDNGVEISTTYLDGVQSTRQWVDLGGNGAPSDVHAWQSIEEYYDTNGDRSARIEVRDDGVEITTTYEAGVRTYEQRTDVGPSGAPSDARVWERIETYYDENGDRSARIETRDNGIIITNEYDAGVIRVQTKVDRAADGGPSDAAIWETNTSYFSTTGQLEAREIIYDNADVSAWFYEDGVRSLRLQFDGDDSASWLVRETLYDAAGQVAEINTYDTAEEVPPQYGFWDLNPV